MKFACAFILGLLPLLPSVMGQGNYELSIIHINDLHARYDDINDLAIKCKPEIETCYGGYARNVATIKRLQSEAENSIFVNAGDNYFGTLYHDLFKWRVAVNMLNALKADAIVSISFVFVHLHLALIEGVLNSGHGRGVKADFSLSFRHWAITSLMSGLRGWFLFWKKFNRRWSSPI